MYQGQQCCRDGFGKSQVTIIGESGCCSGVYYTKATHWCDKDGTLINVIPSYMYEWDYEPPSKTTYAKLGLLEEYDWLFDD